MPIVKQKAKARVQTFNGGENSTAQSSAVKTPFGVLARNCTIDKLGKVSQRIGLARTGDNPDTLISQYTFAASSSVDDKASNDGVDTSISYVDGKFSKAASFNGTTSLITVATTTGIDFTSMGASVITTWVYVDSDGENDTGAIFTKGNHYAHVFGESGSTVKIKFVIDYGAGTDAVVETSTTMSINAWHKIELHYNADESLDVYIDGAIASYDVDTTGSGTIDDDSSDPLIIGNNAAASKTFDGEIEDFRIYDGTRAADKYELDKIVGLTWFKVGSTVDRVYRIRDTDLERLDDNLKGWTTIDTGFTADTDTNFVQCKDELFILNGVENVHSMDTSEIITDEGDTNTDPPKGTVGAWSQNKRFFVGGSLTVADRELITFSDVDDAHTFDRAANRFRVSSKQAGRVKWIQSFKLNELIIYKEDSIFVLNMTGATPLTDWSLQPVNVSIGCKAGRTVQDIGNDHVFLDNEGFVRLLSRTTFDKLKTSVISEPVQAILDTINIDAIEKSCSQFIDGKYFLAIPTGTNTENNITLVWDTQAAALLNIPASGWTVIPDDTWYPSYFSTFEFGDNELRLVVADNRNVSLVYKHVGNFDNGAAIEMELAGPEHSGNSRGAEKIWGPLHVVFEAGEATTVTIQANIDAAGYLTVGTLNLTGSAPVLPIDLPFNLGGTNVADGVFTIKQLGRGKTCIIKILHNTYNVRPTFFEYELWSTERAVKETP